LAVWLISIIYVILGRSVIRMIQHYLYYFNFGMHRLIVIGKSELAQEVIDSFQKNIKMGYKVVQRFDNLTEEDQKTLLAMKIDDKFDEILVATGNLTEKQLNFLNDFSYINHVTLKYVADIFEFPISNFEVSNISGFPIVELKKTRLDGWGRIYKRIFDIIASSIIIILLSPVMLIVALAIKVDSRGSLFFSYQRIGERGKPFTYFKFRSMRKDAHKLRFDKEFLKQHKNLRDGSPMIKFQDDPRITRVGKVIRKFSLDELPELFNVWIGKMSLVGPRPHEVEEVAKYENYHKKVLTIKPGMTGMAQVSGRSDLDFDEEVRLDVWYMENWSFKLDLMILFKTPFAVFKKRKVE
jgi:exopolysaccharide biosynthesis polyprenyl glycosylphosphotransferase